MRPVRTEPVYVAEVSRCRVRGHPNRARIPELLTGGELIVGELPAAPGARRSVVARAILTSAVSDSDKVLGELTDDPVPPDSGRLERAG
jgi:hypothetical protein